MFVFLLVTVFFSHKSQCSFIVAFLLLRNAQEDRRRRRRREKEKKEPKKQFVVNLYMCTAANNEPIFFGTPIQSECPSLKFDYTLIHCHEGRERGSPTGCNNGIFFLIPLFPLLYFIHPLSLALYPILTSNTP